MLSTPIILKKIVLDNKDEVQKQFQKENVKRVQQLRINLKVQSTQFEGILKIISTPHFYQDEKYFLIAMDEWFKRFGKPSSLFFSFKKFNGKNKKKSKSFRRMGIV